ncbi:hypothetical protein BC941DRAFT_433714 [Chlamydoabsidia padenii]|nr:hypothetical protein BC941DRAFT_433714 [Chlamydoabsidia padenii]
MASDDNDNYRKYAQVPPPPPEQSSSAPPVDFSNALQKARAIAEKLKQAGGGGDGNPSDPPAPSFSGTKRSYYDDHNNNDSSPSRYDTYESKRSAYDSGASQPSYTRRNEPPRYGLGSEERQRYQPSRSDPASSETIKVPNRMVGIIIGRGGDNLKKFERNSGARIQIDQDSGESERQVTLTGEQDQIQLARDMIQQMVRDANDNTHGRSGPYDEPESHLTVMVPSHRVGLVIGRGGETIRDLEQRSGAKIKVLPEQPGDRSSSSERVVSISGDKKATEKGKSLVEDIIHNQPSQDYREQRPYDGGYGRSEEGGSVDTVRIPKSMVGLIIGRGGETVRALQAESGARIVIDKYGDQHSDEKTLTIHGTSETIAIAKSLISEKVESGQNPRGGDRFGGGGGGGYRGGHGGSRGDYGRGGGSYRGDYYGSQDNQQQDNGYDYSQYNNYYAQQYGDYDPYKQQQSNDQSYGYDGYNYEGSQQPPADDTDKGPSTDNNANGGDSNDPSQQQTDGYYGQYYDQSGSDQPQWTQEAYNQYYQQYYANNAGGDDYQQQYEPTDNNDDHHTKDSTTDKN